MLLWICFGLLSAAVATFLIRPSGTSQAATSDDPDMAVYRDQLASVDADAQGGVIDPALAASARAEIGRRLIRQSELQTSAPRAGNTQAADRVLTIAAAAIPLMSLALYIYAGSPALPARPLAERLSGDPDTAPTTDLIAKVEARLRDKPDDGEGWAVIAPIYLAQGRAVDAAQAFGRAMALVGEKPERLAGLAKANILANNGIVNDPARKAYERLLVLDPGRTEAKFWLAIADEQSGKVAIAAAAYRALLVDAPADAPWRKPVEERLAALEAPRTEPPASAAKPSSPVLAPATPDGAPRTGPTPAEFVAAAQKLPPEMREQMIGRMIAKSTDALKQNAKDVSAWSRLVTGQAALGKTGEAAAALKEAGAALVGDRAATSELDALRNSLGL
jgi:cytochrome c-type biogenesis protein CcmH